MSSAGSFYYENVEDHRFQPRLTASDKADEAATVEQERRLLFGDRFLLLANNRTLEAKDKLNRQLNADSKAANLSSKREDPECSEGTGGAL